MDTRDPEVGDVWRMANGTDFRVCWIKGDEILGEVRRGGATGLAPIAGRETKTTLVRNYGLVYAGGSS